ETVRHRVSRLMPDGFTYRTLYTLTPRQPAPGLSSPPAPPLCFPPGRVSDSSEDSLRSPPSWDGRGHGGTGISTCCASTTPFGLALAPDSPWADEPSPGTLGHSAEGFLPPRSLLIPAFALDHAPPHAHAAASQLRSTLPYPSPNEGE